MLMKIRRFLLRSLKEMKFLPQKMYVSLLYEYATEKKINLKNPAEFNEKIQWYKVYYRVKLLNQLVDKFEVRAYVKEKIGEQYLNNIYGVYNSGDEVDFDALPSKFVIKGIHASGFNLIVDDKEKLDKSAAKKIFRKWLSKNQYFRKGLEWAYKDVKRRLMAEEFMKEEGRGSLLDYKFYCFNGKAKFFEVHLERAGDYKRAFYDLDFTKAPFRKGKEELIITEELEKPSNFDEMVVLANKLADKLPFVRVDFYSVNGKSVFGEMTFYPGDGRHDFYPDEYNKIIGDLMVLPKIPKGQKYITEIS